MKYIVAAVFTLTSLLSCAQSDYELLWRIDGKELDKTSFLFGTMHVSDERVYNFSDSVLLAFDSAEILAKELSRSDVFEAAMQKRFSKTQNSAFKDQFDEEEYTQIREAFRKRTKLDLDKVDNANPLLINQLLRESQKKDDKSSLLILDEYLEECALRMNKQVVGLEKPFDGIRSGQEFSNSFEKEFFKMRLLTNMDSIFETYDKMQDNSFISKANLRIENYRDGKLPEFNMEENSRAMSTFAMKDRNTKMAQGLDSLMKKGSVFCAVGASHLPGEYGLIEMLREKGYTVEVVRADFTGEGKRLMKKYEKLPAGKIERLLQGFTAKMKGSTEEIEIPNSNMKMDLWQDRQTGMGQFAMVMEQGDIFSSPEKQLDLIVDNYRAQNKFEIKEIQDIEHQNVKGRQIDLSSPAGFDAIMWLFTTNGFAYIFMEMVNSSEDFKAKKSDFLQSIRFFPIDQLSTLSWNKEMSEIEQLKLKIQLPNPRVEMLNYPIPLEQGSFEYMRNSVITAVDRVDNYSISVNQYYYPVGYQPQTMDFTHSNMLDILLEATGGVSISKDTLQNNDQMYLYEVLNIADTGSIHVVSFVRGSLMNNIVLQTTGELDENQKSFLKNWEVTPWKKPEMVLLTNEYYEILGSGDISEFNEFYAYYSCVDSSIYQSILDVESGVSADIIVYTFNDLAYFENEDSLIQEFFIDTAYSNLISPLEKYRDGYTYAYEEKNGNLTSHVYLTWKNNMLFEISYNTAKDIDIHYTDSVFTSFKIIKENPESSFDIFSTKEDLIKSRLYSADTATYESALSSSTDYHFSEERAKDILKSLRDSTPTLFDNEWSYLGLLTNLYDHTSDTSLAPLKEIFEKNVKLESYVLGAFSEIESEESLNLFSELFKKKKGKYTYNDFAGFYTKKELVKTDYAALIELIETSKDDSYSVSILESYFEKNHEDQSLLAPYGGVFTSALRQMLDTINPKADYYIPVYTYVSLVELASYAGVSFKDMSGIVKSLNKTKNEQAEVLAYLIEIGMGADPKASELSNLKSDEDKLSILLEVLDLLGPKRFYSLIPKEEFCRLHIKNDFYYEEYGSCEVESIQNFNYTYKDQELEIYHLAYTSQYSESKELASCVLGKNDRLIYSTLYIGEADDSDPEKSKNLIIEDFEEYYNE
ncbi:TraB/GumN family protein [Cryomorphaceae bacterium 1068]|nr:TraB/GumN family protein [Cryomorphaceae bacterium 1068]